MDVVVVESPTKAKSINKYLGSGYRVLSSYGHVRDLPEKDGSVLPDEDFRIIYELLADREKRVAEIARALKDARHLYLATDPDREGEAISCSPRSRTAARSTASTSSGWCFTRSPGAPCSRRCVTRASCTTA
jgi:DNA topoisomerase IA